MTKLARELLFPLIAVVAAFIVGGILILLVGDSPFVAYRLLLGSALSWPDGIGYTLFHATPLSSPASPFSLDFVAAYSTSAPKDNSTSPHLQPHGWESSSQI
jgi:ABC-type uncharacterized transport system permease subunit